MSDENLKINTFGEVLAVLENGQLSSDLTELHTQIVAEIKKAAANQGGGVVKGSLNIAISYKLKDEIFEISAKAESKLPPMRRGTSVLWSTDDNKLTRGNPRQMRMFTDVNDTRPAEEVKDV